MVNFIFVIPLKTLSSFSGNQWVIDEKKSKEILRNLERTLLSFSYSRVFFEGELNVSVIISGHESPFSKFFSGCFIQAYEGLDVKFVENSFDRPNKKSEYMEDKEKKKQAAFNWIYDNFDFSSADINFLMIFDADDLISNDFFKKTISSLERGERDICLMSGFLFDYKNGVGGYINGVDRIFYRNCGSSFISLVEKRDFEPGFGFVFNLRNHVKFPEISESCGREVKKEYFPVVLYLVNHGQNDVSERYGEKHMVNFVKQYKCSEDEYKVLLERFGGLL